MVVMSKVAIPPIRLQSGKTQPCIATCKRLAMAMGTTDRITEATLDALAKTSVAVSKLIGIGFRALPARNQCAFLTKHVFVLSRGFYCD